MYRRVPVSAAKALLLFCSITLSYAGDTVNSRELKLMITGNTVEGRIVEGEVDYKMYFHPSGLWVREYGDGKTDAGNWRINESGALCSGPRADRCRLVKQRGEEQYELYNLQGRLELTIEKVTLGNPDRLKEPAKQ
jgi:hypothetical protein